MTTLNIERVLSLRSEGHTYDEIDVVMDLPIGTTYKFSRSREGRPLLNPNYVPPTPEVVELREEGLSYDEIDVELDLPVGTTYRTF